MTQINKIERDHSIGQVSRLEDLKPAMEKPISNIPRNIGPESANNPINNVTNPVFQAARQAGIMDMSASSIEKSFRSSASRI